METKDLGNELEMCQIALMKRGQEWFYSGLVNSQIALMKRGESNSIVDFNKAFVLKMKQIFNFFCLIFSH